MKKILFLFTVAILFASFSGIFLQAEETLSVQQIEEKMDYGLLKLKNENTRLHFLRFSLEDYQLRPIQSKNYGRLVLSSREMLQKSEALAVVNANFFDEKQQALGLIIDQKKMKNPLHPSRWWASFLVLGKKASLVLRPHAHDLKNYDFAIQAGPRLVVEGKPLQLKSHVSAKSAIGVDREGRIVLVATEGSLDIRDFARYLSLSSKKGGLGLVTALNLDGGSSTQLYIKTENFQFEIPSFVQVPVGIGVFPR